jgi:hypothetical protein
MLECNINSLKAQTDQDYEQLMLEDPVGQGIGYANRALATVHPEGKYVLVLDDDDLMLDPQAIAILKVATTSSPELVIFRANHKELGILPSPVVWNNRPLKGHIGSISFVSRQDLWKRHIKAFGVDEGGDYAYLKNIWSNGLNVMWLDELLTGVQRISRGRPE